MITIDSKIQSLRDALWYLLLFLMIFLPYQITPVKASLIFILIILSISFSVFSNKLHIAREVLFWYCALIGLGLFFITWGLANFEADAIKVLPVYVLWPIVYFIILCTKTSLHLADDIIRLFFWATLSICVFSILFILSGLGIISSFTFFNMVVSGVVSTSRDFVSYNLPSITSLLFLVPYLISGLILWKNTDNMPVRPLTLYIVVIISLITMIFAARRVFWITVVLTPVLTVFFLLIVNKKERLGRLNVIMSNLKKMGYLFLFIIICLTIVYRKEIHDLISYIENSSIFVEALTFKDEGTAIRDDQLHALIESWTERPLLGAGHGASSQYCIRSSDFPWMYELYYAALLFQTGILGFLAYGVIIFWIYYMAIKMFRHDLQKSLYLIPSLVGMSCFLIANATNTYLLAYDHMWTVFIPVALINFFMIHKSTPLVRL